MNQHERNWRDHRDELLDRVVKQGRARKRRRGFIGAVTVVALVVAIAGGLYLPDRNNHSLRVANDHATTTTVPPAQDQRVLLIGDSVMRLAEPAIEHAIPNAQVDVNSAWQLGDAVAALKSVKEHGGLLPTIVIHLGDNGPSEGDVFDKVSTEVRAIMDMVGSKAQVYFVTLKLPRKWESDVNGGLYEVGTYPNAHVLAWHDFAIGHDSWFLADGFHLSPAGQTAYAGFILNGIRPPVTSYTDPFAGHVFATSGFVVTDDPKAGADQGPSSFSLELFDDAGHELGPLPRATISNDVLNSMRHELVVTDDGIHLEAVPLDASGDLAGGCIPTEKNGELAVALCGTGVGVNLLGNRILVNNGTGWRQLIGLPPTPSGVQTVVGHWAWASPSPDGRWVAASWSGECEVPTGFIVAVADGSVHTVTGEAGAAWGNAPESSVIGWHGDGSALGVFGGDSACGGSAPVQRGIYLVAPETGARRLFLALTPSQGVFTWNAVDDKRNP